MKKAILGIISLCLVVALAAPAFAADNGFEWDLESQNQYDLLTDGLSGYPVAGQVCVDVVNGSKVIAIDASTDKEVRFQVSPGNFSATDFLDVNKKFVFQYDVCYANFASSYQALMLIHRGASSSFLDLGCVEGGNLKLQSKSGTVEGYETLETNKWYNFAFVIDAKASTFDFYINGVLGFSGTFTLGSELGEDPKFEFRCGTYETLGGKAYADNVKLYTADVPDNLVKEPQGGEEGDSPETADFMTVASVVCITFAGAGVVLAAGKKKKR